MKPPYIPAHNLEMKLSQVVIGMRAYCIEDGMNTLYTLQLNPRCNGDSLAWVISHDTTVKHDIPTQRDFDTMTTRTVRVDNFASAV